MARFYATAKGRAGSTASRLGDSHSGVTTVAQGHLCGVRVEGIASRDTDTFIVSVTDGAAGHISPRAIASIKLHNGQLEVSLLGTKGRVVARYAIER